MAIHVTFLQMLEKKVTALMRDCEPLSIWMVIGIYDNHRSPIFIDEHSRQFVIRNTC